MRKPVQPSTANESTTTAVNATHNFLMRLLAGSEFRDDAKAGAPEIELVQLEAGVLEVLDFDTEGAVVAQIATHTEMVREKSHDAAAHVECEVVVGNTFGIRN